VLINEMYELIRRKYSFIKSGEGGAFNILNQVDQRHHVMTMLGLLYDVMRHAYKSDEFKENVGFMMATITDPRLKDEIYESLNPIKIQ